MIRTITGPIKRAVLRLLANRGYVLIKQYEYARIVAGANSTAAGTVPMPSSTPELTKQVITPLPREFASAASPDHDQGIKQFLGKARAVIGGDPPTHAAALFHSLRHLSEARVPGDIVDCGDGSLSNITLAALALVALGDTGRRLVMLDVSGDPSHRAEIELPLWGSDTSDLSDPRLSQLARQIDTPRPPPEELAASCYPLENLRVVRYPTDTMDLSRPIAYLGLIADSYDANRAAIHALFGRVSVDGIVAVEGKAEERVSQPGCVQRRVDSVEQYLAEAGIPLAFRRPTDRFRIAINRLARKANGD